MWCGGAVVLGCIAALVRCGLLIQQTKWHSLLLGQSVFNDHQPCRYRLGCGRGWGKELCIRWGLYIHPWEGALSRGWHWDFPTRRWALFPVALASVFPCMLLTSVPIGRLQKQSGVTLNFPNKKFLPCDAASRQNPLTTCSSWHFYDIQILFLCLFRTSLLLLSVRALPTPFSFLTRRVTADCSGSP